MQRGVRDVIQKPDTLARLRSALEELCGGRGRWPPCSGRICDISACLDSHARNQGTITVRTVTRMNKLISESAHQEKEDQLIVAEQSQTTFDLIGEAMIVRQITANSYDLMTTNPT